MQRICDFDTLTGSLRSLPTRKRVAVVCPGDSHTEYVIRRALEEQTADFLLVDGGLTRWNLSLIHISEPTRPY